MVNGDVKPKPWIPMMRVNQRGIPAVFWKSWIKHFVFYLLVSFIGMIWGVPQAFFFGAGISQELTQFSVFKDKIPWWDYVMDFIADVCGILLASFLIKIT